MLKQNYIAKQFWHIQDIIKDAMFTNSKLFKKFQSKTITIIIYLKNSFSNYF